MIDSPLERSVVLALLREDCQDEGLAVLACVSEKRNHGGDPIRAGAPRRVDHNEQLHQMLIGRWTGRLNDKNVMPPNILLDFHVSLAIGKRADDRPA